MHLQTRRSIQFCGNLVSYVCGILYSHSKERSLQSYYCPTKFLVLWDGRFSSTRHCLVQLGTARFGSTLLGSARHCSIRLDTLRFSSALLGSARHCSIRLDTTWFGSLFLDNFSLSSVLNYELLNLFVIDYGHKRIIATKDRPKRRR